MLCAFDVSRSKFPFHYVLQKHGLRFDGNFGSKRCLAVPQLPKHKPETVHVGLAVVDLTGKDFWCYVQRSAAHCASYFLLMFGHSYVCKFHSLVVCQLQQMKNKVCNKDNGRKIAHLLYVIKSSLHFSLNKVTFNSLHTNLFDDQFLSTSLPVI